jgi:hypothetical protein
MLGIAAAELGWAYVLSILAALLCVVYGLIKFNDAGPLSEELRDLSRWAPERD